MFGFDPSEAELLSGALPQAASADAPVVLAAADGGALTNNVLDLFVTAATLGGGAWTVWGAITFAAGLKDQNGPQTQSGLWQAVGGIVILAAAQLFKALA